MHAIISGANWFRFIAQQWLPLNIDSWLTSRLLMNFYRFHGGCYWWGCCTAALYLRSQTRGTGFSQRWIYFWVAFSTSPSERNVLYLMSDNQKLNKGTDETKICSGTHITSFALREVNVCSADDIFWKEIVQFLHQNVISRQRFHWSRSCILHAFGKCIHNVLFEDEYLSFRIQHGCNPANHLA